MCQNIHNHDATSEGCRADFGQEHRRQEVVPTHKTLNNDPSTKCLPKVLGTIADGNANNHDELHRDVRRFSSKPLRHQ